MFARSKSDLASKDSRLLEPVSNPRGFLLTRFLPELLLGTMIVFGLAIFLSLSHHSVDLPSGGNAITDRENRVAASEGRSAFPIYSLSFVEKNRIIFSRFLNSALISGISGENRSSFAPLDGVMMIRFLGTPQSKRLFGRAANGDVLLVEDINSNSPPIVLLHDEATSTARILAMTPDGNWAVSISRKNRVMLWNLQTKSLESEIGPFERSIHTLAFSGDGATLAIVDRNEVSFYDRKSAALLRQGRLPHENFSPMAAEFSPDGKSIAVGDLHGEVAMMSAKDGRILWNVTNLKSLVLSLAFSKDGKTLLVGTQNGGLSLLETPSGELFADTQAHDYGTRGIHRLPDGEHFITYGYDGHIRRWSFQDLGRSELLF